MLKCGCGRTFKRQCDLSLHKPHCKGPVKCGHPNCECFLKVGQYKYCSRSCSASHTNSKRKHSLKTKRKMSTSQGGEGKANCEYKNTICLYCRKELPPRRKYCDTQCQAAHTRETSIKEWFENPSDIKTPRVFMKQWLIEQEGECCHDCGWAMVNKKTGNIPIEMHHKDGDHENNRPENLTLLCPNCHSLTDTYRYGNKGNGRQYHKEYYHKNK